MNLQFYLLIIVIFKSLYCYHLLVTDDTGIDSCKPLIIEKLENQKIQFAEKNHTIIIDEQNNVILELNVSDSFTNYKILFQNTLLLNIKKLILQNINATKNFIEIQQIGSIFINNLEINNQINNQTTLLMINQVQNITIQNFKSNHSFNNQFYSENIINIGDINADYSINNNIYSKIQLQINQLHIQNSNFSISSTNININKINQQQQSQLSINARDNLFVDFCNNCNLSNFYSVFIEINNYFDLFSRNLIDKDNLQSLRINNFNIDYENLDDGEYIMFSFNQYKRVTIRNIFLQNVQFQFNDIQTLHFQNMTLNLDINNPSNNQINIYNCQNIIIEKVKNINTNSTIINNAPSYFSIFKCNTIEFHKFNINSIKRNYFFDVSSCENATFKDFQFNNVYGLLIFNLQIINNVCFDSITVENQFSQIFEIKEPLNNFLDDTQAVMGSLIQYQSTDQIKKQKSNILIVNTNVDFGGSFSRFFSLYIQYSKEINIRISNSNFRNMFHQLNGGCIRAFQYDVSNIKHRILVQSSKFYNCSCSVYGGAIFTNGYITLENVVIEQCKSKFGGALVIYDSDFLQEDNDTVKYIDNYSQYYHQDKFVYWNVYFDDLIEFSEMDQNQKIIPKQKQKEDFMYNIFPGIVYIIPVILKTLKYPFHNQEEIEFDHVQDEPLLQNLNTYISDKQAIYPYILSIDLTYLKQKSYLLFKLDSKVQDDMLYIYFKFRRWRFLDLNLQYCQSGQQLINYVSQSYQEYDCQYCSNNSASYSINSTTCTTCDSLQFQYCYSNVSYLNVGYYRKQLTINKFEIYKCLHNLQSCIGGEGYGDDLCNEGLIGIECKCCDITGKYWNQTFGNYGYYSCVKCSDIKYNTVLIIVLFFLFLVITYLIIISNTESIEMLIKQSYLSKLQLISLGSSVRNLGLASTYTKILSFNVSILFLMQQQMSLSLQKILLNAAIQFQNPLVQGYVSLDCALSDNFAINENYSKLKLLLFILCPLVVIPVIIFLLYIQFLLQKRQKRLFQYTVMLSIIYLTFIIFYNSILSIVLDALFCRTFSSGDSQSLLDMSVSCDNIQSNQQIAFPALFGYCIGIPLSIIIVLYQKRKNLQRINVMFKYGFLYKEYKVKFFYWEIIRFFVRVIQIIVSKLFISNLVYMNCANIVILISYLTILLKLQPFQMPKINKLELISILINILNLFSLIIYQISELFYSLENSNFSQIMLIISQYLSLFYIIGLLIMIIYSSLNVLIFKAQKYEIFQSILSCNFCKKKIQQIIKNNQKPSYIQKLSFRSYIKKQNKKYLIISIQQFKYKQPITIESRSRIIIK